VTSETLTAYQHFQMHLLAHQSQRGSGFSSRAVPVGFIVDKVALSLVSLSIHQFTPLTVISQVLHTFTHLSQILYKRKRSQHRLKNFL